MLTDIDNILKLSVDERLEIMERIWDSLRQNKEDTEIPAWHKDVLLERLKKYEGTLAEGKSWEEVKRTFLKA